MIRRMLTACILASVLIPASAQLLMKNVFKAMPDSVVPYLSQNNRLDFIDFVESGMKAEVKNLLDGMSEMTSLTDDSLTIRLNEAVTVTMILLPVAYPSQVVSQVVGVIYTYTFQSGQQESVVYYYTTNWQPMIESPQLTVEAQQRIRTLKVQTIFNWEAKNLNKY